jgi:hypothetical protein
MFLSLFLVILAFLVKEANGFRKLLYSPLKSTIVYTNSFRSDLSLFNVSTIVYLYIYY